MLIYCRYKSNVVKIINTAESVTHKITNHVIGNGMTENEREKSHLLFR